MNKYSSLGRVVVLVNVIAFAYLYLMTEALSCVHSISKVNIRIAWAVFCALIVAVTVWKRKSIRDFFVKESFGELKEASYIFVIVALIVVALVMAYVIIPSNNDSMKYHLPRVMNWIQNRSVDYYFTFDDRQLFSQPLAEYAILHVYLMIGNASCINLVQWYAYAYFALLIFLILVRCGISEKLAMVGSLVGLTVPIIIAESVTTQNDIFAGIWTLMYLYLALDFTEIKKMKPDQTYIVSVASLGIIAGLAFMSKAQGVIPIFVISIWILIARIKSRDQVALLVIDVMIIGVLALLIALPYFVRNYNYAGDILAMSYFGNLSISTADPRALILNLYKNWSMGARTYSSVAVNRILYYAGVLLGIIFRLPITDASITNPNYLENNWDTWFDEIPSYHMDRATAPLVSWLFLACCIVAVVKRKSPKTNVAIKRVLVVSIFISLAYVYWQPWISRLMIPVYMLMILYIVFVINDFIEENNVSFLVMKLLPIVLVFTSLSAIQNNGVRFCRAFSDEGGYRDYFEDGGSYWEYSDLVCYVGGLDVHNIGMLMDIKGYEYPLWVALKRPDNKLLHVDVTGENMTEEPDCIIKIECGENELGEKMSINDVMFTCTYLGNNNSDYSVWEKLEAYK